MSTRRDTELTSAEALLFDQLRGLYRHVPFTQHDFAILAPNAAATLNPDYPSEALPILWDVLDAQDRDKYTEALLVLLGMSASGGNVLDRTSSFNNDVHPRTVSRWADTALKRVVRHISSHYSVRMAEAYVTIKANGDSFELSLVFGYMFGDMEEPTIQYGDEDPFDIVTTADSGFISFRENETLPVGTTVDVEWPGLLRPIFNFETDMPARFIAHDHYGHVWWANRGVS